MFKELFCEKMANMLGPALKTAQVLELGAGTAQAIIPTLTKCQELSYVGVEPNPESIKKAKDNLKKFKNVRLLHSLAYHLEFRDQFDLCFSLSALEHVKNLRLFLEESVAAVKPGGLVVHRYDLGHALSPSSVKERLQVFLGNHFPWILPENKFVSYVDEKRVVSILENLGAEVFAVTYHQMPDHKEFFKHFKLKDRESEELLKELVEWEFKISPMLGNMEKKHREKLFPAICVWARKSAE